MKVVNAGIFYSLIILFLPLLIKAQLTPNIAWQKCYGSANQELLSGIDTAHGNGYVLSGRKPSCNGGIDWDLWIIKVDMLGNIQWEQCYGGSDNDAGIGIVATADGGYIVLANTRSSDGDVSSYHGNTDLWILKLDGLGNIIWQKALGGSGNESGYRSSIVRTPDSNYLISCTTQSTDGDVVGNHGGADMWIVKFDNAGSILWQRCLGGSGNDAVWQTKAEPTGEILVCGAIDKADGNIITAYGKGDGWVAKLSFTGNLLWQNTVGSTTGIDWCSAVGKTTDNGYVIGALTADTLLNGYGLIKIDSAGTVQWYKNTLPTLILDIQQAPNSADLVFWGRCKGGIDDDDSSNNFYIERIDHLGKSHWHKILGGNQLDHLGDNGTIQLKDGSYMLSGMTLSNDIDVSGNHGSNDGWVVKLSPDILNSAQDVTNPEKYIQLYPNPVQDVVQFTSRVNVNIISHDGKVLVAQNDVDHVDISQLSNGLYYLVFKDKEGSVIQTEKVVKVR